MRIIKFNTQEAANIFREQVNNNVEAKFNGNPLSLNLKSPLEKDGYFYFIYFPWLQSFITDSIIFDEI